MDQHNNIYAYRSCLNKPNTYLPFFLSLSKSTPHITEWTSILLHQRKPLKYGYYCNTIIYKKETTAKTTKKINNRKKQIYFSHIIRTISGLMCEYTHISSHHDIEQDQQPRSTYTHIRQKASFLLMILMMTLFSYRSRSVFMLFIQR